MPRPLRYGDTIGFVSPSSPATFTAPKRFERATSFLKGKGFKLLAGELTGRQDSYRSGTIKERATEFNAMIRNPEVRCIMSVIGGANSNSLLPYIDYEALKTDPKIVIGYSDMTALLLGIYAKTGLVTYYGPALVASFGEMGQFVESTFDYFRSILVEPSSMPNEIPNPSKWTEEFMDWESQDCVKAGITNHLQTIAGGTATGRLIVGNLNTMAGIIGSPFMPTIMHGDILVLEDSMKTISTVERSFAHLQAMGVFEKIGGLVLGKHERFQDLGTGRRPSDVLLEVIGSPRFPILAEYDCSHTHPMITLPIGVQATLDATRQVIALV